MNRFPTDCILLEFEEEHQTLHFNPVEKGRPRDPVRTHGFEILHICADYDEAQLFAKYFETIKGQTPSKPGRPLTIKQAKRQIREAIKFAKAYNRLLNRQARRTTLKK